MENRKSVSKTFRLLGIAALAALAQPALAQPALAQPALAQPALAQPALAQPALTPPAQAIGWEPTDFLVGDLIGRIAVYDQDVNFKGYLRDGKPANETMPVFPAGLQLLPDGRALVPTMVGDAREIAFSGAEVARYPLSDAAVSYDTKAGSDGRLYATIGDKGGVLEIGSDRTPLRTFGGKLADHPGVTYHSIAVLPGGLLWAGGVNRLEAYDLNTGLLKESIPFDKGQTSATSMFYSATTKTVLLASPCVGIFERTTEGEFVRSFPLPAEAVTIFGVTRGPNGKVYASDYSLKKIHVWAPDGTPINQVDVSEQLTYPVNIVWAGNGHAAPSP